MNTKTKQHYKTEGWAEVLCFIGLILWFHCYSVYISVSTYLWLWRFSRNR